MSAVLFPTWDSQEAVEKCAEILKQMFYVVWYKKVTKIKEFVIKGSI